MVEQSPLASNIPLFTYAISSADLRHIEIGERAIHLRRDPELGWLVCGEMPGSRAGCAVNLSQILLEAALTSEGWKEPHETADAAGLFGVRLGRILGVKLCEQESGLSSQDNLELVFTVLLNSMNAVYTRTHTTGRLQYNLVNSPLHTAAEDSGLQRGIASALRAFISMAKTMVRILAPDWTLAAPTEHVTDELFQKIIIAQKDSQE